MTIIRELKNGVRVAMERMDHVRSVSIGIWVNTGSVREGDDEGGASHFIEHMAFKGTPTRTAEQIAAEMDAIGGSLNAFTSKECTCFYAKVLDEHLPIAVDLLSDITFHSTFEAEELEREKRVIVEEILMTEDTPDDLCLDVLAEAYFGKEGYGRPILGPVENVKRFSRDDLFAYIAERYAPENIVISFAGNIDVKYAEELVEKYFEGKLKKRAFIPREKKLSLCGNSLFKKKDIEQVHIAFAYPSLKREDARMDAALVMNVVLGGGMSSRLFQKVREQMGLAYTVYSYISSFTEGGLLAVYAGVNPSNVQKAQDAILQTIAQFCREKFTDDEFLRGKEQLKSSVILGQENTASQMVAYGKHLLFTGEVLDLQKRIRNIDAMTKDDCAEVLALSFDADKMAASAVGRIDAPLSIR